MAESSGIRARSPVVGLPRGRLTQVQVLAQSVSAVAPSAVMVTLPVLVMAQVGRGVIAVFVVATLLVAAVGYCIREFATRMAAVSGLYSYTVKGLGPTTGFAAGWSLLVGYGAAAMASLVGAGSYLAALLGRTGVPQGTPTVVALSAAAGVVALLLMLRGVQLSARIMLAIEVFAILAASAVLVVAFAAGGGAAGGGAPSAPSGPVAAGFAVLLAITAFVGFESAGTVAREARHPFVTVTRAIRWTPVVVGVLYLFAAVLQLPESARLGTDSLRIVLTLPDRLGGGSSVLAALMEAGIAASWFACVLGSVTALSRTLFAMGREGVFPGLGRTHRRFGTPAAALLTTMPLIVAVPVLCLLVSGSSRATLVGLLAVSAHGYIVAYVLVCMATPVFLRRIGESTRGATVVGTVTAACLVGLIVWVAVTSWGRAEGTSTAVYLAIMAAGALVHLVRIRPRPAIAQRIGVYDETTESDLLGPSPPWAVRR
ncbi:APC family permease [Tsukamurella tyrosinosolvens]|uniref:APC family permease n=1 Tax=Tsukamurella tyrosinosolvens TaxID=57704 RepID=UPI0036CE9E6C